MLLVIDVGNTNVVLGVFQGKDLKVHWRLSTQREGTADEYGVLLKSLFELAHLTFRDIKAAIISCVVPPLQGPFEEMCQRYFGVFPLHVGPGIRTGMPILYDTPRDVGADRIRREQIPSQPVTPHGGSDMGQRGWSPPPGLVFAHGHSLRRG